MPAKPLITAENLNKTYRIPVREHGLASAFKSLLNPNYTDVPAVSDVSFRIDRGEVVGFIGPNGAGKTTTMKMLSGLLYPTSGRLQTAGYIPSRRESAYLKTIAMVMGNKSQLNPSITVADSFYITKQIYQVGNEDYRTRVNELTELLELGGLLPKLARNLSLGERAKCEFACALLYQPEILFLDEPTLGMDVSIQIRLRDFIRTYNQRHGTTILITSHYMADISSLCQRILLINHGKLIYDGRLDTLNHSLSTYKLIKVTLDGELDSIGEAAGEDYSVIERNNLTYTIRTKKDRVSDLTARLLSSNTVIDLSVENPPVENLIDKVYQEGISI